MNVKNTTIVHQIWLALKENVQNCAMMPVEIVRYAIWLIMHQHVLVRRDTWEMLLIKMLDVSKLNVCLMKTVPTKKFAKLAPINAQVSNLFCLLFI